VASSVEVRPAGGCPRCYGWSLLLPRRAGSVRSPERLRRDLEAAGRQVGLAADDPEEGDRRGGPEEAGPKVGLAADDPGAGVPSDDPEGADPEGADPSEGVPAVVDPAVVDPSDVPAADDPEEVRRDGWDRRDGHPGCCRPGCCCWGNSRIKSPVVTDRSRADFDRALLRVWRYSLAVRRLGGRARRGRGGAGTAPST